MITVGLVKEIFYIARVLNKTFYYEVTENTHHNWILRPMETLTVKVTPAGELEVWYRNHHIWGETVEGATSFFGVESCDSISRIIACINNDDYSWKERYYYNEFSNPT